jgi:ribosomal protein S18 acetylase RimI-like enzyme
MEQFKKRSIEPTDIDELQLIYPLYDAAIRYQRDKGFPVWQNFDRNVLVNDVNLHNHYKVVVDAHIAMVFSICYSDAVIWRHMEKGDAIYLHRIAVNPLFKGQRLFALILEWTRDHAQQRGLKFIRMDTWADNLTLIDYYKSFGLNFVGYSNTPDSPQLPLQNRNLALALLQMPL